MMAEGVEPGRIAPVAGGGGGADRVGDLLERQPAPQVGDDDLPGLGRELGEGLGGGPGVEPGRVVGGGEPAGGGGGGGRVVLVPPAGSPAGVDRPVADDPVQPG